MIGKRSKAFVVFLILVGLIVILIASAAYSLTINPVYDLAKTAEGKFLAKNYDELKVGEEGFSSLGKFSLLDSSVKGKEVFLTGENHATNANAELELEFLKYFYNEAGVRYYLQELSPSDAAFLNEYLETGNEEILREVFAPFEGTAGWTQENYEKYRQVYAFNRSLPENEKIRFVGVDLEHQIANAYRYLYWALPETEAPSEIAPIIDKLKVTYQEADLGHSSADWEQLRNLALELQDSIKANYGVYQNYLGDKFFEFELVVENTLYGIDFHYGNYKDDVKFREKVIYDNFKKQYEQLGEGAFYGQFGGYHVVQQDDHFAGYLNNSADSPVKGKVLSIRYLYQESAFSVPQGDGTYKVEHLTNYDWSHDEFDIFPKYGYTLFKLTGSDSPFAQDLIWFETKGKPPDGVTTDYYQYFVLIRNSPAQTPLGSNTLTAETSYQNEYLVRTNIASGKSQNFEGEKLGQRFIPR